LYISTVAYGAENTIRRSNAATGGELKRIIPFLLGEKSVVLSRKFVKTEAAGDAL